MAKTNERLRAVAASTGARVLDSYPDVCGQGPVCPSPMPDGTPKFADPIHLRPVFVRYEIRFMDTILERKW